MHAWKQHKETPCVVISISNEPKYYVSLFIFFCFFFYKIREQEGVTGSAQGVRKVVGTGGREEVVGKMGRRMNMVQIMYTHVCKRKNDTC
jgi:hypothetical protein